VQQNTAPPAPDTAVQVNSMPQLAQIRRSGVDRVAVIARHPVLDGFPRAA
jgi:hypothetical protein